MSKIDETLQIQDTYRNGTKITYDIRQLRAGPGKLKNTTKITMKNDYKRTWETKFNRTLERGRKYNSDSTYTNIPHQKIKQSWTGHKLHQSTKRLGRWWRMGGNGTSRKKKKIVANQNWATWRKYANSTGGNSEIPHGMEKTHERQTGAQKNAKRTTHQQNTKTTQARNNIQEKDIEWRGLIIYLQNIQCITTQRQNTD